MGPVIQAAGNNELLKSSAFTAACQRTCSDTLKSNKKSDLPTWVWTLLRHSFASADSVQAIALIVLGALGVLIVVVGAIVMTVVIRKRKAEHLGQEASYSQLMI